MTSLLIGAIALLHCANACFMWIAPERWYHLVPGVAMMGPFNSHFIRDVALTFALSGGALLFGLRRKDRTALLFGATWPVLHALFHLWIWTSRGLPLDEIALANLLGIQLPAWLAFLAAWRFVSPRSA